MNPVGEPEYLNNSLIIYNYMYEDLFPPLIILLFLVFIFVIPVVVYAGFRRIADPVPFWYPLVPAAVVLLVMVGLSRQKSVFGDNSSMAGTLVIFSLMLLLNTLAVISSYLRFGKKTGTDQPWPAFTLLSFVGIFLMFWSTMGESREGGPLTLFGLVLPLTGWIFDIPAAIFHIQDIVYSPALPVYSILFGVGLFLEMVVVAGLFYALMNLSQRADKK
jgi:hypothetical protein